MANVYVRERKTDEIVDTIDVGEPPHIQFDDFLSGLRMQMDRIRYYVDTSEVERDEEG